MLSAENFTQHAKCYRLGHPYSLPYIPQNFNKSISLTILGAKNRYINVASDLGLHCLLRLGCPNKKDYYCITHLQS